MATYGEKHPQLVAMQKILFPGARVREYSSEHLRLLAEHLATINRNHCNPALYKVRDRIVELLVARATSDEPLDQGARETVNTVEFLIRLKPTWLAVETFEDEEVDDEN